MRTPSWIVVVSFVGIGCATPSGVLSPTAQSLRVVSQGEVNGCAFVAAVMTSLGRNMRDLDTNVRLATVDVRNKAARSGATHIIMQPPKATEGSAALTGTTYCANCVEVVGMAYRCTRPGDPPPPVLSAESEYDPDLKADGSTCYQDSQCASGSCVQRRCKAK